MSVFGWLLTWRFFMGLGTFHQHFSLQRSANEHETKGIGAEYPLSAIITSEWAAVGSRPRMLASVFLMQSLGQLCAALVGFCVLVGLNNSTHFNEKNDDALTLKVIDSLWRYIAGVGAIPALVAILFRLTIPETGRFTLDVSNESKRALKETRGHYGIVSDIELADGLGDGMADEMEEIDTTSMQGSDLGSDLHDQPDESLPIPFSKQDLMQYFIEEGNWRYLAGTSITWFLLDFAFYGCVALSKVLNCMD